MGAAGRRALSLHLDLGGLESVERAGRQALAQWGRVDALVNNAVSTGPADLEPACELLPETVEVVLRHNTDPSAPPGRGGWGIAYGMSKGASHRVAGALATELSHRGLVAFNLDPGFVPTERMGLLRERHGFAHLQGVPPEVPGAVIAWLRTSPEARELNGRTVRAQRLAFELGLGPG